MERVWLRSALQDASILGINKHSFIRLKTHPVHGHSLYKIALELQRRAITQSKSYQSEEPQMHAAYCFIYFISIGYWEPISGLPPTITPIHCL